MQLPNIKLVDSDFPPIFRRKPLTLQVNLGYECNQQCVHCHVNAGPHRKERLSAQTATQLIQVIDQSNFEFIDLTGGAPELNPDFRRILRAATSRGVKVIDRCNLTVLFEPGQRDTAEFLAEHNVQIVASLPCYLEENVEKQRGKGIFKKSIDALLLLNKLGYGTSENLELTLVFNPQGATLPPSQQELEQQYKQELWNRYEIVFNHLFTITNMPINRFGAILEAHGEYEPYMELLKSNYRESNLHTVMCHDVVSVDWRGYLYDCDFNQMLGLPLELRGKPAVLQDLLDGVSLYDKRIKTADHCYGCTAGQGSSCTGALAS